MATTRLSGTVMRFISCGFFTNTSAIKAVTICRRMAFGFLARKRLILRFCLIHLKNSLPTPLIEIGDLRWGTLEVIGDERQFAALVFIEDFNSAPGFGRFSARLARQNDDFIGHDQAITVNGRALRIVSQIGFWPGHEIRFAGFDIGPELGLIPRPADKDS